MAQECGAVRVQLLGLGLLVTILLNLAEYDTAENIGKEALSLSRGQDLAFLRMMTISPYATALAIRGKHEQEQAISEEAARLTHQLSNPWVKAMSFHLQGHSERNKENWAEAAIYFSQAAELFEEIKDLGFSYISWSEAGHMKRKMGDIWDAEEIYQLTIIGFQEMGHQVAVAHQLECFGILAAFQNRDKRAAKLLGAAQSST